MTCPHTPGPWAVHPITAQVDAFRADGEIVPVCQMLWPTELRSEDETEANAHLIAAAPDLLALARLEQQIDDFDCIHDAEHQCKCGSVIKEMIARARTLRGATIAKAEGR